MWANQMYLLGSSRPVKTTIVGIADCCPKWTASSEFNVVAACVIRYLNVPGVFVPMYPPISGCLLCSTDHHQVFLEPLALPLFADAQGSLPFFPTHPSTHPTQPNTERFFCPSIRSDQRAEVSPPKNLTTSTNEDDRAHTVSTTTMLAWNISLLFFLPIHSLTLTPHFVFPSHPQSTCTVLPGALFQHLADCDCHYHHR